MKACTNNSALLVVLAGLLFVPAAWADSVSGTFELDGKALAPSSVAGFRIRDQADPRQFSTYVMLSTSPMNVDAIARGVDPYTTAINDPAVLSTDHIGFRVNPDGTVVMNAHVAGTQYIDGSGIMMGARGSLASECSTNTLERVTCSVKNAKPAKTMGGKTWAIDVRFDTAVAARVTGKPLPADGGEPGKALDALIEAAKGDDLASIIALLAPSEAEDYQQEYSTPEQNLASAKQMFDFSLPRQHRITGGEYRDEDTALLEVEGVPNPGMRVLYIVTMERTDGRWGFKTSQWAGMLD